MRNLKKILALVLAMVMSLSLMATASAAGTTAAANDYTIASTVLQGLDVVIGDEGGIREESPITRAEVATLAYRIHTADVTDSKANLYYDLQEAAFNDLASVEWAKGYIGYAHNAQIVKGNGDGTFNPNGNITGYEVLAMALRAIGYGKNGEFEGAEWQINTAAWARREGLLEGVSAADQVSLDKAATRGMVFQILFNAIQHTDMAFSYITPDLYAEVTGDKNTMALRLGLEKITGVVVANEWADLRDGSVLGEGKSCLDVDGKEYNINYATELEDIGESRLAYVHNGSEVLYLADSVAGTALNTVEDNNGEETTVNALKGSLNVTEAEHFVNFDYSTKDTSEWIIRYVIDAGSEANGVYTPEPWNNPASTSYNSGWIQYLTRQLSGNNSLNTTARKATVVSRPTADGKNVLSYTVTIQPETVINSYDKAIMKQIFYTADRVGLNDDNFVTNWVEGEVYVGTSSLEDKSDVMNWNDFWETYVDTDETKPITEAGNGQWLKIIDNNNDGKAEYVLLTNYVLDKIIDSTTKNDETTYYYNYIDSTEYTYKTHTGYERKVGDIVLYAIIDGTMQVQLADTAVAAFKAVNYKERQATTTDGGTHEQSDIINGTKLPGELVEVDENIEYTLYLDKYGYVRAYSNETRYALVTEVYPTNGMNQAWVTDHRLTAEVMLEGEKTIKEYSIANNWYSNGYNPFYIGDNNYWTGALNTTRPNWLQPATHSLDWNVAEGNHVFLYNNSTTETNHSWTNVARYTPGDDENSINLFTAADRTNGNRREDYIQLAVQNVSSKDPLYAINDTYYTNNTSNPNNHYVRAVDDTLFFVVSRGDKTVRQYVGYSNVVNLDTVKNGIHAMYAVAVNSATDTDVVNYWTADVIVIEIERFDDTYESVALVYSNDTKISGDVKYLQVLDSAKGSIGIIPNNVDIWRSQFNAYGFYGLMNVEATEDANIYTADIYPINWTNNCDLSKITGTFNDNGIYFGRVRSTNEELERSTYITVDVLGNEGTEDVERTTTIRLADKYGAAWSIDDASTYYNEAGELIFGGHGSNRVEHGDYIIWVEVPGTSSHTNAAVGFIVDLSDKYVSSNHGWDNPDWLGTIAGRIASEQNNPNDPGDTKTELEKAQEAALAALKEAYDANYVEGSATAEAVQKAYDDAVDAVNAATTVDDAAQAGADGVKAIEDAAKGDGPDEPENPTSVTITFQTTNAAVTVGEETVTSVEVEKGTVVKFTVAATDEKYTEISVKVGETELSADENGVYTVTADEAKTVTVEASEAGEEPGPDEPGEPVGEVTVTAGMYTRHTTDVDKLIAVTDENGVTEALKVTASTTADENNQLTFKASDFTSSDWTFTVVDLKTETEGAVITGDVADGWTITVTGNTLVLQVVVTDIDVKGGNVVGDGGMEDSDFTPDTSMAQTRTAAAAPTRGWLSVTVKEGYELNRIIFIGCTNLTDTVEAREPETLTGNRTRYWRYIEIEDMDNYLIKVTTRLKIETDPTITFSVVDGEGNEIEGAEYTDYVTVKYNGSEEYSEDTKLEAGKSLTIEKKTVDGKEISFTINGETTTTHTIARSEEITVVIKVTEPAEDVEVTIKWTDAELQNVTFNKAIIAHDEAGVTKTVKVGDKITLVAGAESGYEGQYVVAEADDDDLSMTAFTLGVDGKYTLELTAGDTDATYTLVVNDGKIAPKAGWPTAKLGSAPNPVYTALDQKEASLDNFGTPDVTNDIAVKDFGKYLFAADGQSVVVTGGQTVAGGTVDIDLLMGAYGAGVRDKIACLIATVGGVEGVKIWNNSVASDRVEIFVNGKLYTSVAENSMIEIPVEGNYYTIKANGTNKNIDENGDLGTADSNEVALNGATSIKFNVGANANTPITIEDNYYKLTITNGATSYEKLGKEISWSDLTDKAYTKFSNGKTGAEEVLYELDGTVAKAPRQNVGTTLKFPMPAQDLTVTKNLWQIQFKGTTAIPGCTVEGYTAGKESTVYVTDGTENVVKRAADSVNVLVIDQNTPGNSEIKTGGADSDDLEATTNLIIEAGNFKQIMLNTTKVFSDSTGKIDLSTLDIEAGTYVTVQNTTGDKYWNVTDGELAVKTAEDTTASYIPVGDLKGVGVYPIGAETLTITTGFRALKLDTSGMTEADKGLTTIESETINTTATKISALASDLIVGAGETVTIKVNTPGRITVNGKVLTSSDTSGAAIKVELAADAEIAIASYTGAVDPGIS